MPKQPSLTFKGGKNWVQPSLHDFFPQSDRGQPNPNAPPTVTIKSVLPPPPPQYTITTTTGQVRYAGNGSTTTFSVAFQFFESSTLRVRTAIGTAVTELGLGTDYEVTGGNGSTGTVTLNIAPHTGTTVIIDYETTSWKHLECFKIPAHLPLAAATACANRSALRLRS